MLIDNVYLIGLLMSVLAITCEILYSIAPHTSADVFKFNDVIFLYSRENTNSFSF